MPGLGPAQRTATGHRGRWLTVGIALVSVLVAACGGGSAAPPSPSPSPSESWVEQDVTFTAGGMTIYGTYRHPSQQTGARPAALLIAGSGPTDRNGNATQLPHLDTLQSLAQRLSDDGVATLRYDKLGSGRTGLGPYANQLPTIGVDVFAQEAAAALSFLGDQPGVDRNRLAVLGHSEGALFALLLATSPAGPVPAIHALGLLEPLSGRYLDVVTAQLDAQFTAAIQAGQLTGDQVSQYKTELAATVASLRSSGTVPANLPAILASLFNPSAVTFLAQADRDDPGQLAEHLTANLPVLVTCSDADIQVSCADVGHLVAGLNKAATDTTLTQLTGVDHVLKEDPSRTATDYDKALPFSQQVQDALHTFVADHF